MSIIGNLFRGQRAAAATSQQQPATPPAPAPAPAAPAAPDSKLADLAKLWDTPATNSQNQQQPTGPQPLFNVDPAKVSEAVAKLNFAGGVSKELLDKAMAGDSAAMMQALNLTAQNSFQAAMLAVPGMVEPAVRKATGEVSDQLPQLFKQMQLASTRSDKAALKDPALAPIVEALKSRVALHNPQATPGEVMALVEQQMQTVGEFLNPQKVSDDAFGGASGYRKQSDDNNSFDFLN